MLVLPVVVAEVQQAHIASAIQVFERLVPYDLPRTATRPAQVIAGPVGIIDAVGMMADEEGQGIIPSGEQITQQPTLVGERPKVLPFSLRVAYDASKVLALPAARR